MKATRSNKPAFPLATAMWMIKNTTLTFSQIGDFCGIHQADVAVIGGKNSTTDTVPMSPVGIYITKEEIERCEADETIMPKPMDSIIEKIGIKKQKEKKYISASQKRDRLNAILWLVGFHPNLKDVQMSKLVGSTKDTVSKIRNGTHREMAELVPKNPSIVGLCSKKELDDLIDLAEQQKNKQ